MTARMPRRASALAATIVLAACAHEPAVEHHRAHHREPSDDSDSDTPHGRAIAACAAFWRYQSGGCAVTATDEVRIEHTPSTPSYTFVGVLDERGDPTRGRLLDANGSVIARGYFRGDRWTVSDRAACIAGDCTSGDGAEWHPGLASSLYVGAFDAHGPTTGTFRAWRDGALERLDVDGKHGTLVRDGYRVAAAIVDGPTDAGMPRLAGERTVTLASGEHVALARDQDREVIASHDVKAARHPELPPGMSDDMAAAALIARELGDRLAFDSFGESRDVYISQLSATPALRTITEHVPGGLRVYLVGLGLLTEQVFVPGGGDVVRTADAPSSFVAAGGTTVVGEIGHSGIIVTWPKLVASPLDWAKRAHAEIALAHARTEDLTRALVAADAVLHAPAAPIALADLVAALPAERDALATARAAAVELGVHIAQLYQLVPGDQPEVIAAVYALSLAQRVDLGRLDLAIMTLAAAAPRDAATAGEIRGALLEAIALPDSRVVPALYALDAAF